MLQMHCPSASCIEPLVCWIACSNFADNVHALPAVAGVPLVHSKHVAPWFRGEQRGPTA
jgi:hypothetical protein